MVIMNVLSLARAMVVSKKFVDKTDHTEEWYGTQYRIDDIDVSVIEVRFKR